MKRNIASSVAQHVHGKTSFPGGSQQLFHPHHDLRRCNFQHARQLHNDSNGRAVDAAFDQADVCPVKSRVQRQFLLGDFLADADLAQRLPECLLRADLRLDFFLRNSLAGPLRQRINAERLSNIVPRRILGIWYNPRLCHFP
jgi:hypothetical protein